MLVSLEPSKTIGIPTIEKKNQLIHTLIVAALWHIFQATTVSRTLSEIICWESCWRSLCHMYSLRHSQRPPCLRFALNSSQKVLWCIKCKAKNFSHFQITTSKNQEKPPKLALKKNAFLFCSIWERYSHIQSKNLWLKLCDWNFATKNLGLQFCD